MTNKNNKDKHEEAPSLDLSFAYGTSVHKQLTENDIRLLEEQEAAEAASTGDTTIRTITSLYTGKRSIVGLNKPDPDDN
ncbi:MAG TPA: hypothetical protein VKQ06_03040 [Gammaproteobacteria bacterium]|nr:hypothetical protein [Gammaproteobacteria bacterium]